jgi:hypothetical protein
VSLEHLSPEEAFAAADERLIERERAALDFAAAENHVDRWCTALANS